MTESNFVIIAVDGGAAAGKSSTSRALSERYHLLHVDTGSFYRALTLKLLELGIEPISQPRLIEGLNSLRLGTEITGNSASITLNGWIPDASIRSPKVNDAVSKYAALPEVRAYLLDYQRSQAKVARDQGFKGLIMEGRDIGSTIFPKADLRIFLHADPEKRALRRAKEGISDSIEARDRIDSSRQASPLKCPEGATFIDTSDLNLDEVVAKISQSIDSIRQQ